MQLVAGHRKGNEMRCDYREMLNYVLTDQDCSITIGQVDYS